LGLDLSEQSICIDIPECIKIDANIDRGNMLHIVMRNVCGYDLIVYLDIRDEYGRVINSISTELETSGEKHLELSIGIRGKITISGSWGLKGTTLKLPLKGVVINYT